MVDFDMTNYARAKVATDLCDQTILRPRHGGTTAVHPAFVYRELSEGTIQLQGLRLRSERTRPNGRQSIMAAHRRDSSRYHFDRARPASAPMRRAISYCI